MDRTRDHVKQNKPKSERQMSYFHYKQNLEFWTGERHLKREKSNEQEKVMESKEKYHVCFPHMYYMNETWKKRNFEKRKGASEGAVMKIIREYSLENVQTQCYIWIKVAGGDWLFYILQYKFIL